MSDLGITVALADRYRLERELGAGRHGHRLPRARSQARPQGRDQGAPARAGRRARRRALPRARSGPPPTCSTRTSSPLFDSRRGRTAPLFYVMPFVEGEIAARAAAPREAAPGRRRGAASRREVAERARLCAPPRRHPPRHQAREYPAARRPALVADFGIALAVAAAPAAAAHDRDRHVARHAAVHVARAGDGRARNRPPAATSTRSAR